MTINEASLVTSKLRNLWNERVGLSETSVPGVERQQLGMDQDEGVHHLLSRSLATAVELLNQTALQELDALLTQRGVDQPLHGLREEGEAGVNLHLHHSRI